MKAIVSMETRSFTQVRNSLSICMVFTVVSQVSWASNFIGPHNVVGGRCGSSYKFFYHCFDNLGANNRTNNRNNDPCPDNNAAATGCFVIIILKAVEI